MVRVILYIIIWEKKNDYEQIYLVRNCFFEPTQDARLDKDFCLKGIAKSFLRLKKPAIISAHRLNFIGSIRPKTESVI